MQRSKRIRLDFWQIVTLLIALVMVLFLVYPLVSLFLSAFRSPATGAFSMENFQRIASKKRYIRGILTSLEISSAVTEAGRISQ